jgi:hypothetical protein
LQIGTKIALPRNIMTQNIRSIHARAISLLDIYGEGKRGKTRRQIARECARRAVEESDDQPGVPRLDFRPGIGSGRAADWHLGTYREICVVAETIRRTIGWSGDDVRIAARATVRSRDTGSAAYIDLILRCPSLPNWAADGHVGRVRALGADDWRTPRWLRSFAPLRHIDDRMAIEILCWAAYAERVLQPAYGVAEGKRLLCDLQANPALYISGYLASTILAVRSGDASGDYRACSGCEHYTYLASRTDVHDLLLARAPEGASGPGWEQTFPHEHERIARLRAAGWNHTLRMSDSIWHAPAMAGAAQ